MNRILMYLAIAIFSIFVGSQITEGFLLVPYWKTLSTAEFYEYYSKFGPSIGRFYTILTIIALSMPISLSLYCYSQKSQALKYSLVSTFFAILILAFFYFYFKDVNQQFYNSAFTPTQLKSVLTNWSYWHWLRVLVEILSLVFLILAVTTITQVKYKIVLKE